MRISCWSATLLLLLAAAGNAPAQTHVEAPGLFVTVSPGIAFSDRQEVIKYSSYAIGVGLTYGSIAEIGGANLMLSLESGYCNKLGNTELPSASFFPTSVRMVRIPVMTWCTVETNSDISPFVRFGAGISWSEFIVEFSDPPTSSFGDWGFAWGIGGGIRIRLSQAVSLSFYLDDWVTTEDILENIERGNGGSRILEGSLAPIKVTMVGLRGTFRMF